MSNERNDDRELSRFFGDDDDLADDTPLRRPRRAIRIIALIIVLAMIVSAGGYVVYTMTRPLPEPVFNAAAPVTVAGAPAEVELPDYGASAVALSGATGVPGTDRFGAVLASSGGDEPLPIASISKLITALVILDDQPLGADEPGPTLTFSAADAALYDRYYVLGATIQPMRTGQQMSLRDALELMLVVSACNYADAVSTTVFGSRSAVLAAADDWLERNGLTGTTLVEPTGIDAENVSTPSDLLALARLAQADPTISAITGMERLDVPGFGPQPNNNDLLGVDGVTGIKTGTLEEAGSCLLFSASLDVGAATPVDVIGVVLGGNSGEMVDDSVEALLKGVRSGFHEVALAAPGDPVGTVRTAWGAESPVVTSSGAAMRTWSDAPITGTVQVDATSSRFEGEHVGSLDFAGAGSAVSVPVALKRTIADASPLWRITHPFDQ